MCKVTGVIKKVLLLGSLLGLVSCASVNGYHDNMTGKSPVTQAEYNASLPDDVYPDSRGRLLIVDRNDLNEEGKAVYDRYMSPDSTSLAGIQGPGGIRLHSIADKSPSKVDARVRELVRLAIAREFDHDFEWTMHEPVALQQGISAETIDTIRYRRSLKGVPGNEAVIIRMVREMFDEHKVSSATYAELTEYYSSRDLIEITQLMGGGMNSFFLLNMFDVHLPYDRPSGLSDR